MNCNACEKLLKAWLDGELEPQRSQAVEQHLASCEACGRTAQDYERISRALKLSEEPAPLPSLEILQTRAQWTAREERGLVRSLQRVSALAAAVLLVALGTLLWPVSFERDPSSLGRIEARDNVMDIVLSTGLGETDWEEDF